MTAQIAEVLILDGREVSMAFCPPLPLRHPRLIERSPAELRSDKKLQILRSTAYWRGYVGTWEIKDSRLFLVDVRGRFQLREGEPLLADWFSGVLRVN